MLSKATAQIFVDTEHQASKTTMEELRAAMNVVGPSFVGAAAFAVTVLQCFQDTLTSSQTTNRDNNDKTLERYNTRSHGEEGACNSLVCPHQYPSPALSTPRRVLSLSAVRSCERRIRAPSMWPRPQSGTNTLYSREISGMKRLCSVARSMQAAHARFARLSDQVQTLPSRLLSHALHRCVSFPLPQPPH